MKRSKPAKPTAKIRCDQRHSKALAQPRVTLHEMLGGCEALPRHPDGCNLGTVVGGPSFVLPNLALSSAPKPAKPDAIADGGSENEYLPGGVRP